MINLLPPSHADAIRYGRQNTVLRKWLVSMAAAIAGLVLILVAGWVYIGRQSTNLQSNINVTKQQLQTQNLAQVQKDAKEIKGDISVINKVLSQEVDFSKLIQTIGKDMPAGSVLTSLSLSNKVTGGIDLSAGAKDYASAAQIAANLSDPSNNLFSKVDIVNVSCNSAPPPNQLYKCTSVLRALFSKTAQNSFLTVPAEAKQ
jgi:Tfp pilus assembly protein PilN